MKKFLLTLTTALIAVIAFAQKDVLKQPIPFGQTPLTKVERQEMTPRVHVKNLPTMNLQGKKTKNLRRAAISSIDELQGDFVICNYDYDYEVDEETQEGQLVPETPSRSASAVSIEVTGTNEITIYGIYGDLEKGIKATVDLENDKLTIPVEQVIGTSESYGDIYIRNADAETENEPLTATIYEGSVIKIDQKWYSGITVVDEETNEKTNRRWGAYSGSFIAPANGTMEYKDGENDVTVNVLIEQDEETKEVTVWNFADFGVAVDITLATDKTFIIDSDQVVYYDSTGGKYYPYGLNAAANGLIDLAGTGTETMLTATVPYWTFYSEKYYWFGLQNPFTITLIDGSSFLYPELEIGELVTPPTNLQTKAYPFTATLYAPSATQYSTTVQVGWDGNDVYFQGLDKDIPTAWVKGTYDAETGTVAIPVTYTGIFEESVHYFAGYGGTAPRALTLSYDADADTFDYSATVMIYKGSNVTAYAYFYNGFFIGVKPVPTTIPEGLTTVEMPFKGNFSDGNDPAEKTGTVKVGRDGDDLYIQGLFSSLIPNESYGWIKGTFQEIEGTQYVIFPMNQYVGDLSNGLAAYLTGYIPAQEEEGSASAGNVVFTYTKDDTYEYYEAQNAVILTRFKSSLSTTAFYQGGLTIGNAPVVDGINVVKATNAATNGAMFNLAGQRVAEGYKGLVIKNGKKYVVK